MNKTVWTCANQRSQSVSNEGFLGEKHCLADSGDEIYELREVAVRVKRIYWKPSENHTNRTYMYFMVFFITH